MPYAKLKPNSDDVNGSTNTFDAISKMLKLKIGKSETQNITNIVVKAAYVTINDTTIAKMLISKFVTLTTVARVLNRK